MPVQNALLLGAELVLVFGVLALAFRFRRRIGIGLFVAALATLHLVETYLASVLYVGVPGGFVVTPGSSVLFTGKLLMLLLVYIKEDATAVRQPIHGLLVGNALLVALVLLLRLHETVPIAGPAPDLGFLEDMGWLMVWGSLLLYADSIMIIIVYERLGRAIGGQPAVRILLSAALVLTFDQVLFYAALRTLLDAPLDVLTGGWVAKMMAAAGCSVLIAGYLRFVEPDRSASPIRPRLGALWRTLTYRERYSSLLAETGRDALTGAMNRHRLEAQARPALDLALASGQVASLVLVDLDGFGGFNRRHGKALSDEALRRVAAALQDAIGPRDHLFRHGGDEFAVFAVGLTLDEGVVLTERIREAIAAVTLSGSPARLTAAVTVATGPEEGVDFDDLFALARDRLLEMKKMGRSRATSLDQMLSAALLASPQRRLSSYP